MHGPINVKLILYSQSVPHYLFFSRLSVFARFRTVFLHFINWLYLKVRVLDINIWNITFPCSQSHFKIKILNYSAHVLSQLVYGLLLRINDVQR